MKSTETRAITLRHNRKAPDRVSVIPSKSELHRLLIASALSDSETVILCGRDMLSKDIEATSKCLSELGAKISFDGELIRVTPISDLPKECLLDCYESGSTLRFMLPVVAALGVNATFTGRGRLPERPLDDLLCVMKEHGISFSSEKLPLTVSGKLSPGLFSISGGVSSQYITGLLFALSLLSGNSTVSLTSPLESAGYVKITLDVLKSFGVCVSEGSEGSYSVSGGARFTSPREIRASGDWSNASYFLASGALFAPIRVSNLDLLSSQGDMKILDILADFGADIEINEGDVTVSPNIRRPLTVDLQQIPDLLPTLAALAVFADGESVFTGGKRLRIKESDRISSVANMINSLGGEALELPEGLIVRGKRPIGGVIDSANDHRIAMASALISLGCESDVTLTGADAVSKSYPTFFEEFGI